MQYHFTLYIMQLAESMYTKSLTLFITLILIVDLFRSDVFHTSAMRLKVL